MHKSHSQARCRFKCGRENKKASQRHNSKPSSWLWDRQSFLKQGSKALTVKEKIVLKGSSAHWKTAWRGSKGKLRKVRGHWLREWRTKSPYPEWVKMFFTSVRKSQPHRKREKNLDRRFRKENILITNAHWKRRTTSPVWVHRKGQHSKEELIIPALGKTVVQPELAPWRGGKKEATTLGKSCPVLW